MVRHRFVDAFTTVPEVLASRGVREAQLAPAHSRLMEIARQTLAWSVEGGCDPTTGAAAATAAGLLNQVSMRLGGMTDPAPWTSSPLMDGGLQLEWKATREEIEVEVGPDGSLSYLLIERGHGKPRYVTVANVVLDELASTIAAIVAG